MGYMKIQNLYKAKDVLLFKEVYAMEKIHGTSAHLRFGRDQFLDGAPFVTFFSGGEKYDKFVKLFDEPKLVGVFDPMGLNELTIYGEAYGGSQQGMSYTYGKELKFIAFEVKIDKLFLSVPDAEKIVKNFGLEFVHYEKVPAEVDILNESRDKDSVQAVRNGMGSGHKSEGIVIRPLIEVRGNNLSRIMAKHKRDDFRETKTPRVVSEEEFEILRKADEIADEWVTEMRLAHVIDAVKAEKGSEIEIEHAGDVIRTMVQDIMVEAEGEIVFDKSAKKAISKKTVQMFKNRFKA